MWLAGAATLRCSSPVHLNQRRGAQASRMALHATSCFKASPCLSGHARLLLSEPRRTEALSCLGWLMRACPELALHPPDPSHHLMSDDPVGLPRSRSISLRLCDVPPPALLPARSLRSATFFLQGTSLASALARRMLTYCNNKLERLI